VPSSCAADAEPRVLDVVVVVVVVVAEIIDPVLTTFG
jgi:hypothetical protein